MKTWFNWTLEEKLLSATSFLMTGIFLLHDQWISPGIVLFLLACIPFLGKVAAHPFRNLLFASVVLWFLHLISLSYSSNVQEGFQIGTTKLSFLLFPIILLFLKRGHQILFDSVKYGLIFFAAVSMGYSFLRAILAEGDIAGEAFKANVYPLNMHPSYLGLIILTATTLLLVDTKVKSYFLKVVYTLLTLISLYYLRSLGAFVCLGVIFITIPIWRYFQSKNLRWLLVLPAMGFALVSVIFVSPTIRQDFQTSLEKVKVWQEDPDAFLKTNKNNVESNAARLALWTMSAEVISEHPFGVGVGDVHEVLGEVYEREGYTVYKAKIYDPHSQYMQTTIAIGWLGLLVFIVYLILALKGAFRTRNFALFITILSLAVSCLFESMFERQVGVIFINLIVLLLVTHPVRTLENP